MKGWTTLIVAIVLLGSIVGWNMAVAPPAIPPFPAQATATRGAPPTATVPPTYTRPPLPTGTPLPTAPPRPPATAGSTATPIIPPTAAAVQPTPPSPVLPGTGTESARSYLALGIAGSVAAIAAGVALLRRGRKA